MASARQAELSRTARAAFLPGLVVSASGSKSVFSWSVSAPSAAAAFFLFLGLPIV